MNGIEQNKNLENEKQLSEIIDGNLDGLEKKIEIQEAINLLKLIDSEIPEYNIDMTYDEKNDNFYILSGEYKLNIPLKLNQIEEIGMGIANILNNSKKLGITGQKDFRRIYEVPIFGGSSRGEEVFYKGTQFQGNVLDLHIAEQNNRFVEEIYKFTQNVKGIPEEKWETKSWMRQGQEMGNF